MQADSLFVIGQQQQPAALPDVPGQRIVELVGDDRSGSLRVGRNLIAQPFQALGQIGVGRPQRRGRLKRSPPGINRQVYKVRGQASAGGSVKFQSQPVDAWRGYVGSIKHKRF